MKKVVKVLVPIIVIIAVVIVGGAFAYRQFDQKGQSNTEINSSVLRGRIIKSNKMISTEYYYNVLVSVKDSKKFPVISKNIPFTTKQIIMIYKGSIYAGVDLSDMTISVEGKNITVTLPKPKIISNSVDSAKAYYEKSGIMNSIKVDDATKMQDEAKKKAVKQAKKNGLYKSVTKNASQNIKSLLKMIPEVEDNYTITVKTAEK